MPDEVLCYSQVELDLKMGLLNDYFYWVVNENIFAGFKSTLIDRDLSDFFGLRADLIRIIPLISFCFGFINSCRDSLLFSWVNQVELDLSKVKMRLF